MLSPFLLRGGAVRRRAHYGEVFCMKIFPLGADRSHFCAMFKDYYKELDCDEDIGHLLDEYVLADYDAELLSIAVAAEDVPCGFVIYQIDGIENEWCLKEGMGTVRELYVVPQYRGRGAGALLMRFAEEQLVVNGARKIYVLPAEGSQGFFLSLGYAEADEYCDETDCNYFYKTL